MEDISIAKHEESKTVELQLQQQPQPAPPPPPPPLPPHQQQQQQLVNPEDLNKQETTVFSRNRARWYTNEEVASILTSFSSHPEWQTNELQMRPKSGAVLLYSREKVRYRQDGYCWKKRKNGRTTREDHMKLKVQGIECIYGCYVHSAILPTFHRRCYWLLQNPDIVLVHYLNQPPDEQSKVMLTFDSDLLEADTRRSWTNEEIIEEIGSVFGGISQIHHTLSINFPSTTHESTSDQAKYCEQTKEDNKQMMDSSPQSQVTNSTEIEMSVTGNLANQPISSDGPPTKDLNNNSSDDLEALSSNDNHTTLVMDEIMLSSRRSDNNTELPIKRNSSNNLTENNKVLNNLDCEQTSNINRNGDSHLQLQQQQNVAMSMTYEVDTTHNQCQDNEMSLISDEIANDNNASSYKFVCASQSGANSHCDNNMSDVTTIDSSESNNTMIASSDALGSHQTINDGSAMEQNPCSPVTQIYNKIVDDIETYALPLEPNQFSHHHHHLDHHEHPGLSISSKHLHDHQHHQKMDLSGSTIANESQQQRSISSHSQLCGEDVNDHTFQTARQFRQHQDPSMDHHNQYGGESSSLSHDQSDACSVDFTSCDLFGNCGGLNNMESADGVGQDGNACGDTNNLLMNEFDLADSGVDTVQTSGGNLDGANGAGCENLANSNDLHDLMIGMESEQTSNISSEVNQNSNSLLIDSNLMDLFNFKPSIGDYKQQLDVKSTTSDTDALNRLSPMAPLVPRCNSTDNAMQHPSIQQHLDQQYQHHLSSHFISNTLHHQDTLIANTFSEYNHHSDKNPHCSAASTNPSNSTSCSPSPSSSSLLTTGTQSAYLGDSHCSTGSSSHSFIKLPLQQRQKSEQREPSNSVLNSLLPKALSLDGSDLSATRHYRYVPAHHGHNPNQQQHQQPQHRVAQSPLSSPYSTGRQYRNHHQYHQNMLLIPQTTSTATSMATASSAANQRGLVAQQSSTSPMAHQFYHRPSLSSLPPSSSTLISTTTQTNEPCYVGQNSISSNQSIPMLEQHPHLRQLIGSDQSSQQTKDTELLPIVDYVPSWSSSSGGTKILLIGDWTRVSKVNSSVLSTATIPASANEASQIATTNNSTGDDFFVIFDNIMVAAKLIQDNVLRCYSPAHEPGLLNMKVFYGDRVVSEQVVFEVRPASTSAGGSGPQQLSSDLDQHHNSVFDTCKDSSNSNNVKNEVIKQ